MQKYKFKSDRIMVEAMGVLDVHGPMTMSEMAKMIGETRNTVRTVIDNRIGSLVTRDKTKFPATYTALPGWGAWIENYIRERDERAHRTGLRIAAMAARKPVKTDEDEILDRIQSPRFKGLLATSMRARPTVRTALRAPMPWAA